jgi:hypothetical protein
LNYVAQKHKGGCLIAVAAMLLDLTYNQVWRFVPVPRLRLARRNNEYARSFLAFREVEILAAKHAYIITEITRPNGKSGFFLEPNSRHIAVIPSGMMGVFHAVAINEDGIVFDPANEHDRRPWSTYDLLRVAHFGAVGQGQ